MLNCLFLDSNNLNLGSCLNKYPPKFNGGHFLGGDTTWCLPTVYIHYVQSCTGANVKQLEPSREYLLVSSLLFELSDLANGDLGGVYLGR